MATDGAPTPSALVDFVAGTAAGVASLLAGHPFDTVKTRLQTQPHSLPHSSTPASSPPPSNLRPESRPLLAPQPTTSSSAAAAAASSSRSTHHAAIITAPLRRPDGTIPIYRSATHAFRVIVKEEKLLGLYKGVTSPMLGVAVMNASIFGLYGLALRFQQQHGLFAPQSSGPGLLGGASFEPSLTQIMVAGMVSGLGSSLITAPIDLIKIREQMDLSTRSSAASSARPSTYRTLVNIVRTEGVFRGLFRGWGCTAVRDLGYGPYFWSYELMNRYLGSRGTDGPLSDGRLRPLSNVELAVSGGIAGVLAWLSTFWADVIKTKVQATTRFDDQKARLAQSQSGAHSPLWTRSLFCRTAAETYKDGGVRAFFAGVGPTVLRALPVNAVMFIVFEAVKDALTVRGF
ncbi:uncharacterized protein PFL1_03742 [Pseudozyma flocculosa PF-1]|uniref:Related to Carrier protein YMC1, mitochondrial n=2 Tax=Pseudozyma flocculosa TaxID=84751 RepID=A0A5C3F575_9BASI|nr:uncharacterized protein PFL1_03742 [Pseudozyma flocculosa PF-1]EPQ28942.1 hypothetical protein PFL1_03742 [Pseudozyma flocculosa PF-1]SPO38569.1 related to Carrier protein YMC1, mitochondrial precursor [Pseudozyma flocculosa]